MSMLVSLKPSKRQFKETLALTHLSREGLHGNWTMENSKSMLHQWMQTQRVKADYRYSSVGPDHNRSFIAEMGFYVQELGRNIQAREAGSNKQTASKSCAMSLVRQLYHFGVIQAFTGANDWFKTSLLFL